MGKEIDKEKLNFVPVSETVIRNLIYNIRGQQVMLDSDLAMLYQVETKRLNESVKRNIGRFPESFCFQMTKDEYNCLKSQFATSNNEGRGGRRKLPYCFTEPGIAMLSAVLHSNTAVDVSIRIMNTFVEMRRFISSNSLLFEKISNVELKQLEFQNETDAKFDRVFEFIQTHAESTQKIFFNGQIYDAFSLLVHIIQKAIKDIILIDGYVDIVTLNILAKKKEKVAVEIHTLSNTRLTALDIATFNNQYPSLTVKYTNVFHDRFLILDHQEVYHIGASLKDAGRKCFAITLLQDEALIRELLTHL